MYAGTLPVCICACVSVNIWLIAFLGIFFHKKTQILRLTQIQEKKNNLRNSLSITKKGVQF